MGEDRVQPRAALIEEFSSPFPCSRHLLSWRPWATSWPLEKQLPSSCFTMERLVLVGGLPEPEQRDSGAAGGQLGALPASQLPVGGL